MKNFIESVKVTLSGKHGTSTVLSNDYPTILPQEFEIKNSKNYYYFNIVLILVLTGIFFFGKSDLIEKHFFIALIIIIFLSISLLFQLYKIFVDNKVKILINHDGIKADNLTDEISLEWKFIEKTEFRRDGKSLHLWITTTYFDEQKVIIGNLNKEPKEIGHYIELYKRHYSQHK